MENINNKEEFLKEYFSLCRKYKLEVDFDDSYGDVVLIINELPDHHLRRNIYLSL